MTLLLIILGVLVADLLIGIGIGAFFRAGQRGRPPVP